MPIKECTLPEGGKGWQWGDHGKCYADRKDAEKQAEAAHANGFHGDKVITAMDRSMRIYDADGRLHVAVSHISKATVNPYRGDEIPDCESLGLVPDKVYKLLRAADEIEKGAKTFNNLPLLSRHLPVSAEKPQKDIVVGSTGTDAKFNAPYLDNSLVIWDAEAIAAIESMDQAQLSSAYRYKADMTPGIFDGVAYDGVMRDIVGNHVALVESGRAGPDVVVADSNPFFSEATMKVSGKTVAVRAALRALIRPVLAMDAAQIDVKALVGTVTGKTIKEDAARIAKAVKAKGIALDEDKVAKEVEEAAKDEDDAEKDDKEGGKKANKTLDKEDPDREAEDDDDGYVLDRIVKVLEGKVPDALLDAVRAAGKKPAEDESEEEAKKDDAAGGRKANKEEDAKRAMDSAIRVAEKRTMDRFKAIRIAEKEVAPIIGEVVAMDSAEAIYKMALDHLGVDVADVHVSAYGAMVRELGKVKSPKSALAMDAADATGDFFSQFKRIDSAKLPRRA